MSPLCFIINLLLFVLPFRICAQQQNYVFQHLTTKDGLASNKVSTIFQDSKGYYYIGTESGLQKYDGKNFCSISSKKEHTNGRIVSANIFGAIAEDRQGNLWIQTQSFIFLYQPLTQKVIRIEIADDAMNKGVSEIRCFCNDKSGNIFAVTELNIYKYNFREGKFLVWLSIARMHNTFNPTYLLFDSSKNGLWLIRGGEVTLIDIKTKRCRQPFAGLIKDTADIPEGHNINSIYVDKSQNIWLSDYSGILYQYNTLTFKKKLYNSVYGIHIKPQQIKPEASCFAEDNNGKLWIGSYTNGLLFYDQEQDIIQTAAGNATTYPPEYNHYINSLYSDKEGNIWIATDKGINIFNPSLSQFNTVVADDPGNHPRESEVSQIYQASSGDIFVSTLGNGWLLYNSDFIFKKKFYDNTGNADKNLVWSFAEDRQGKIWIGYQHGIVSVYDTVRKKIHYINFPEFEKKTVMVIKCDAKGNIWFGLYSGTLCKWDAATKKITVYKNPVQSSGKQSAPVHDMLVDKTGKIWVATLGNGFYCFDPDTEKITQIYSDGKPSSGIDNTATSLTQINDSVIGITTNYKGVLWFNKKQKTFTSLTMSEGLPVNFVFGLAEDEQKNIWIATTNGLLKMNAGDKKLILFGEEDGIPNNRFLGNIVVLNDGRMAAPTSRGFIYFSPRKISISTKPRDVQIISFDVFNKRLCIDSILNKNRTVNLSHAQNFITIGYASISFLGRNTTQYYYQLQGVDKGWVSAGTQRSSNYTNLSPGHYIFKVKCESPEGILSKNITAFTIYISPPWWFTWWAYMAYFLLAAAVVYIFYRNRIKQLEHKQAIQIKAMVATQEQERKRISRDLHDDVGTKLSALKLFLSSLKEKASHSNDGEIRSLAQSSEQFITEAMQDVRRLLLNLSPAVLEEFGYTTAVEGLVNKINETKQIQFTLVVFGMKRRLQKDYELALYRITQELINNVLKHAEAKHVSLQIGQRDKKIILMIEDDGKGFYINAHKDGYGLQNLEARAKLLQGTMTIDSQTGKGTSVLIEIPDNFNKA